MKAKIILALALSLCVVFSANAKSPVKKSSKKHAAVKRAYSMDELVKNIQYDFARAYVKSSYDDRLNQLAELIIDKKYAVALRGNADSIGTYKGNWVLSQKRSDGVKAYLVKKGVPAKFIVSTAFGSTIPIASNKTAEGRQKNRRVEIKLNQTNF